MRKTLKQLLTESPDIGGQLNRLSGLAKTSQIARYLISAAELVMQGKRAQAKEMLGDALENIEYFGEDPKIKGQIVSLRREL